MKLKTVEEYYRKFGQFPFLCIEYIKEIVSDAQSDIAELEAKLNHKQLWEQAPKWNTPCLCNPDDRMGETWCCNTCGRPTQSSDPCPWWAKLKKYDRFISDTGSVTYFTGAIKIYSDGAVFIGGEDGRLNEIYFSISDCLPYTGPTVEEIKAKANLTEDEWKMLKQAIKEGGK